MGVSRDVTVQVAHQNEVAVALKLVAGVGHDPVFSRFHRRVLRHRDIDAIVLLAVGSGAVASDHAAVGIVLAGAEACARDLGGLGPAGSSVR
jgi:hypothetical protein